MAGTGEVPEIPADHPRALSLHYRHKLVEGMNSLVVTPSGLCAHGRGEAFDYMIGERTIPPAINAMRAGLASLLLAKSPVISINGNVACLAATEIIELSHVLPAKIEVNLFYQTPGRLEAIAALLHKAGASQILGLGDVPPKSIDGLKSNRRIVDPRGIYQADVVLVPLEDGDRTEALVNMGKTVIAIDLNPLSRTAQKASITIVDNIIRCIPLMTKLVQEFKQFNTEKIKEIKNNFNNCYNLSETLQYMINFLRDKMK